ncbi:TylF/MycF/NovP-related O-methyltransferase [Pedobacter panaciterrae]
MDNYFIIQPPYTKVRPNPSLLKLVKVLNKAFRKLKLGLVISPIDTTIDMNTIEQRINYYHLLNTVIQNGIAGDVVELGCFSGQCALLFGKVIEQNHSDKKLHLYDSFEIKFAEKRNVEDVLKEGFSQAKLRLPELHKGYFEQTLPDQLPEKIAFAHIDCGHGGDKLQHKEIMLFCLGQIYPKMSPGSICVLMDYNDPKINGPGHDANPGVKLAWDEFFKGRPEQIVPLYGNQYFHAYFTKQ